MLCDPLEQYIPFGHLIHKLSLLAPVAFEYVLAGQSVHTLAPVTLEYLPAGQAVHALIPDAIKYVPAEQLVQLL